MIAKNIPDKFRKNIENNLIDGKIEIFNGNSKELGAFCGKPFPISVLVIKE